jgi:AraC-like DNA-binding protein
MTHPHPLRPLLASTMPPRTVATLLAPGERPRFTLAAQGAFITRHAATLHELATHLRGEPVAALLLSVSHIDTTQLPQLTRLLRAFPRIPKVAVLLDPPPHLHSALLTMGHLGARALVDVRTTSGWRDLRRVISRTDTRGIEALATERLNQALPDDTPDEARSVLGSLFHLPTHVTTVREVANGLGVGATTFTSRFARAQLPPPRDYLAYARLVRVAHLLENPGCSISQAAHRLEYSSPQSFSRHLRFVLGISAANFRREYTASAMLDRFVRDLLTPYREQLRTFHPLAVTPPWMPHLLHAPPATPATPIPLARTA